MCQVNTTCPHKLVLNVHHDFYDSELRYTHKRPLSSVSSQKPPFRIIEHRRPTLFPVFLRQPRRW